MAQQPLKKDSGDKTGEMNSETLESMWRQAFLIRDMSRDEINSSRIRREEAEKSRLEAEAESIRATEEMAATIREQAEAELDEAHNVLDQVRQLEEHAQSNLSEAVTIKEQAEAGATGILRNANRQAGDEAQAAQQARAKGESDAASTLADAGELMSKARTEAEASAYRIIEEANSSASRIKAEAKTEIERVRADLEAARAAAQQELDTQRSLTDMLRDRVVSTGLAPEAASNDSKEEVAGTQKTTAKSTPVKGTKKPKKTSAKKAKSASGPKVEVTLEEGPTEESVTPEAEVAVPRAIIAPDVEPVKAEAEVVVPKATNASDVEPVSTFRPSAFDELKQMLTDSGQEAGSLPSPEPSTSDAREAGDSPLPNQWTGGQFQEDDEQVA
jgi:hypothetical protein